MDTKKTVFSGIQPSGNLHIGNYLGALKNWVDHQEEADNIFCIVDLHAITVPQDPQQLKQKIHELTAIYFAAGVDPQKSTVFVQSDISAHAELAWIFNCITPMGWMQRMTQFKEKSEGKEQVSVGLFDYPALMAADILLYNTDEVPVGEDQKQHIELTRDIAQKFNMTFGETFKLPEPVIAKVAARVMSLTEPTKKMSKSDPNPHSAIYLTDSEESIRTKIMRATTDSSGIIAFDEHRPGIFNLLEIYQKLTRESKEDIEEKFRDKGYADFKRALADVVVEHLKPFQIKYQQLIADPGELDALLKKGAERVRPVAEAKLRQVKEKVGLHI